MVLDDDIPPRSEELLLREGVGEVEYFILCCSSVMRSKVARIYFNISVVCLTAFNKPLHSLL